MTAFTFYARWPGTVRRKVGVSCRLPRAGRNLVCLGLALLATFAGSSTAQAEITSQGPLEVRILLDNSGSMYPGYEPGSSVTKSDLGVLFIREYPEFAQWLSDFVARQRVLHGDRVSLYSFTSGATFRSSDVERVWPLSPLARFQASEALDRISGWGEHTFLAESLAEVSRHFEGLLWLITDNVVETGEGTPDSGVTRFFETLRDTPRYRSVHLFKLPIRDRRQGKTANLAIYGMVVSGSAPNREILSGYDRLFRENFRTATRQVAGAQVPLFDGQEHLKLKDLSVDTFEVAFKPDLIVRVGDPSLFLERRDLHLRLQGEVRSNLTHHTVLAGRYQLRVVGPFHPDEVATREFRVEDIPASQFELVSRSLIRPIPPLGTLSFDEDLSSLKPVSLRHSSVLAWLKSALFGLRASFSAPVEMSFGRVKVKLQGERLAGVFGSERAPQVFGIKAEETLAADAVQDNIHFQIETSGIRSLVLLVFLVPLLLLIALLVRLLVHQEHYLLQVGQSEKTVSLRRLRSYRVDHELHHLGKLKRRFAGGFAFKPVVDDPDIEVVPDGVEGRFIARLRNHGHVSIVIKPLSGSGSRASSVEPGGDIQRPGDMPPPASSSGNSAPEAGPSAQERPSGTRQPPPEIGRPG